MDKTINDILNISKKACHSVWEGRDIFKFKTFCGQSVDITGFADTDNIRDGKFNGINAFPFLQNMSVDFDIINESYNVSFDSDTISVIICELTIAKIHQEQKNLYRVFTTLTFDKSNDKAVIVNAHFSSPDGINLDVMPAVISGNLKDLSKDSHAPDDALVEYYRDLINNNCDLLIECDISEYVLRYDRKKYRALFDDDTYYTNPDRWFWNMCNTCVHPDDYEHIDIFRKADMEKRIRNNINKIETTFRIRNKVQGYIWVQLNAIISINPDNKIDKMALLFNKLDKSQFNELEFLEKSRRDKLTGVYNKNYYEYLVNTFLKDYTASSLTALVLIDIDDFHLVNDTFGHMTGDAILCQFTRSLNSFFGQGDIVGRMNGDKFCIFIKTMPSRYEVTKAIDNFLKSMHHTHYELGTSLDIHCCAGIVFLENNLSTFSELYTNASNALAKAKNNGKNNYGIYNQ